MSSSQLSYVSIRRRLSADTVLAKWQENCVIRQVEQPSWPTNVSVYENSMIITVKRIYQKKKWNHSSRYTGRKSCHIHRVFSLSAESLSFTHQIRQSVIR